MLFSFTKKVFRTFWKRIKNRFNLKGDGFSEDYMRYVLFTSLLRGTTESAKDSLLVHMDLECPYKNLLTNKKLKGKKLDMWISHGNPKIAIECKYHRDAKNARIGRPVAAGSIFEDLRRLSKIKMAYGDKVGCYFVYLTTKTMAKNLCKNYGNFFELEEGDSSEIEITKEFILSHPPVFQDQIDEPFTCTITNVFADEFCKEESKIYIRIFEVDI